MFIESISRFGFDETAGKLEAAIEAAGWKLTAVHNLQETLKKHGTEVLPVKVFALCHPKHSGRILTLDDERIVSSLMPCRVSVYLKSDGHTYISRLNPAQMAGAFGGVVEEVMTASAADVEEILKPLF